MLHQLLSIPLNWNGPRFRRKGGFGTLEVVIIIAVILSIALLFRSTLTRYATNLIETVFEGDPLAN